MSHIWDAQTYDTERRRLVPCFDMFYGTAVELAARTVGPHSRVLDLGAGTGLLSGLLAERLQPAVICLVDASTAMLARAEERLVQWRPGLCRQELTSALPEGPFDAVVSALAIHHLSDPEKAELFSRVLGVLVPGGVFINAEQVRGATDWQERLFETVHLEAARSLGSSTGEIEGAVQRMRQDRCVPLGQQLQWLQQAGYERVDCFFQWFRFAVYAGWKPS